MHYQLSHTKFDINTLITLDKVLSTEEAKEDRDLN